MTVQSNDPTDYSPDRLRRYLRRYHEISALCDGAHAIRYDGDRIPRTDTPDPMKNVHLKRDMDKAVAWLAQLNNDPRASALIYSHYIELQMTADIADEWDLSQASVHRIISRGIADMSWFLGDRNPDIDKMRVNPA